MSFSAETHLQKLKPFQRRTVDYTFERLFHPSDPVDRFLVADEVGLGKTMIAKGLVAKMIEHYQREDPGRRIDVLYVSSNQVIAQQNYSKIAIVGNQRAAVTDRITKLPLHVHDLDAKLPELGMAVNFIPLTPTTSLDLRSNVGRVDERALLYELLADERLSGRRAIRRKGSERLLSNGVSSETWTSHKAAVRHSTIDPSLRDRFVRDVRAGTSSLLDEFETNAEFFRKKKNWTNHENRPRRTKLIGRLRTQLARTCIDALEPDLIILDEFQRFPRLLDRTEPVGELAEILFGYKGAKTLLLSATPYRMFTRASEIQEDHYADFFKTTEFLLTHQDRAIEGVSSALRAFREGLRNLETDGVRPVREARNQLAAGLGRVMCRTERLGATPDRSGMLDPAPANALRPRLEPSDLDQFRELDQIAEDLGSRDIVEYWKSAPFPLNFMDEYKLSDDFETAVRRGQAGALKHGLDTDRVRTVKSIDVGNARLRGLVDKLDEENGWRSLWLPPSLPYYTPGRPFDTSTLTTKRLLFSAWTVVPKAVAALTSYECERRLFSALPGRARPESQPLQWRPEGPMTELVLSLPSVSLARLTDPLVLSAEMEGHKGPVGRQELLRQAEGRVRRALRVLSAPTTGREDARWYALAPLLLDEQDSPGITYAWLDADTPVEEASAWYSHWERIVHLLEHPEDLGRMPKDIARVLARLGVAGPGTSSLRALGRVFPDEEDDRLVLPALKLGLAFRSLFNLPEAYAIVRSLSETRFADDVFWKAALDYCVAGNLQAVLDEYLHMLVDWVEDRPPEKGGKVGAVEDTAVEAIGIHTADLTARTVEDGRLGEPLKMRTRFALTLGSGRTDESKAVQRVDSVRKAFNSPFWPFVLATTSIGQEGLDFHLYSHAVIHWNLPANPVDLEQREGRVHRFKGHAVRRNLALSHRAHGIAAPGDPWQAMFDAVPVEDEGLQPFWVLPGAARIERHVLALPMSRDAQRLTDLVRLLGIYRLAFGQPRQDELLAALQRVPDLEAMLPDLLIDLSPPR